MAVTDTIAAIATPPGFGAVGMIRISGPAAREAAVEVLGDLPTPRLATLAWFRDRDGTPIDQGIALFFPGPDSFTGEDVLELQGHGGPVVLDLLLRRLVGLGVRLARPGEFSERAFLNGKLDLTQAEAIADLIESGSEVAARLAGRSLRGDFSVLISRLVEKLIQLRSFVEAVLDFPDEDIDFIADSSVLTDLAALTERLRALLESARQGSLVREGLNLVIAGPPNAGKSSLLNALSGVEAAIVTEIPGTTRDFLRQEIQVDGMPLHIVDTAGLRHSDDPVEREGIRRARDQIDQADAVLWVFEDGLDPSQGDDDAGSLPQGLPVILVRNKIDLTGTAPGVCRREEGLEVAISARLGEGLDELRRQLKNLAGFKESTEGAFMARRRHLDALGRTLSSLERARVALEESGQIELAADDLHQAQRTLGEITGEFSSDELLGRIFASFCIGK